MTKIENVTIGSDPEFFLYDLNKGEIISAEGLIGGTKDEPKFITGVGHAIQEDNIMVEFNIPANITAEGFSDDIAYVVDYIDNMLPNNIVPTVEAAAEVNPEYLQTEQALKFGCEPDYNAWNQSVNDSPSVESNIRTCGGHVHVGYDDPNEETSEAIVKAMDLFLGVPSIIMDTDTLRRTRYGKAGAFRFKSYGVEYRVLSNFFIFSDELRKWTFKNTLAAIRFINSGKVIDEVLGERIVNTINNCDKKEALKLIKEFNIVVINDVKIEKYENRG
jgi:hypothetical protein